MITSLYNRYFQKSRSFLYPALGISKSNHPPIQTFLSLEERITPEDRKLVCLFQHLETLKFEEFERKLLYGNPLYHDAQIYPGQPSIYIFDFTAHKEDWDYFLKGKYSHLSPEFKDIIKTYYGEKSPEYQYIDTYLYPEKYYDLYSNLLLVDPEIIISTGELCNPYDGDKEKLVFSAINLEKSKEKV